MTIEEAKKYVSDDNWREYVKLGGSLDKKSYFDAAANFIVTTFDAFVLGDGSRTKAVAAYQAWLSARYPRALVSTIFSSIDSVHAYT